MARNDMIETVKEADELSAGLIALAGNINQSTEYVRKNGDTVQAIQYVEMQDQITNLLNYIEKIRGGLKVA